MKIPAGHQAIMPYLILKNAKQFITFCQDTFDAKLTLSKEREGIDAIMHAELSVSGSTLMVADATDEWTTQPAGMFIYVPDADAVYKKAIDAGATSIMPPSDQNYGRACGIQDSFGNTWWITSVS